MSCNANEKAAAKAAATNGISEIASKAAARNKSLPTQQLVPITTPIADKSPQSKWVAMGESLRKTNSGLSDEQLQKWQAERRRVVADNVRQFHQAIKLNRKVQVDYRSPAGQWRKYTFIPLDVREGRSADTRHQRYMWGFSEQWNRPMCLRLDRVLKVRVTAAGFDPAESLKDRLTTEFNLPREWGKGRKRRRMSNRKKKTFNKKVVRSKKAVDKESTKKESKADVVLATHSV